MPTQMAHVQEGSTAVRSAPTAWSDPASHTQGFVTSNGTQLEYLDWGSLGPTLVLIHGGGDNPHAFDDLAPAFADSFRVIAYSRRGHGRSDKQGPYDVATLTEDLRGLLDALAIEKAHLAGWSMGGNEITAMAAHHPERVSSIVYLDAAYDWADSDFATALAASPISLLNTPSNVMKSLNAYRTHEKAVNYTMLDDIWRVEAYLRESVVIQPDGTLKHRISKDAWDMIMSAILTDRPREYRRVKCPALAMYSEYMLNVHVADARRRVDAIAWEQRYMVPFRAKSIERIQRELAHVEVVTVPGTHNSFFLTSREQVVKQIRQFLGGAALLR